MGSAGERRRWWLLEGSEPGFEELVGGKQVDALKFRTVLVLRKISRLFCL